MASDPQPFQRGSATSLMCSGRLFGAGKPHFWPKLRIEVEPELGGDHHLIADRSEGFANEFLVRERTVNLSGVEECDTAFDGFTGEVKSSPVYPQAGHRKSSCPCSRARWPRLRGRCFQVCVSAFSLLCLKVETVCRNQASVLFVADLFHPVDGLPLSAS